MKVKLINYTRDAIDTLLYTKNTRLEMTSSMDRIAGMSDEDKQVELDYMVNTIKSSWEFVDFTLSISGVTRAFTHQLVRNRTCSYAQQTMRILDMDGFEYATGPSIKDQDQKEVYDGAMKQIQLAYNVLIELGVKVEDARGVLPTNILTNITMKINLRSLSDMMASRASSRTQGEYRDVLDAIYLVVTSVYPWIAPFLRNSKTHACNQLESIIKGEWGGTEDEIPYIKLVDQLRNS